MVKLPKYMSVNGADYELIKRSEKVALFSINDDRRFEVTRIYILPKSFDAFYLVHIPVREGISDNGKQFNTDGSRLFSRKEDALLYFERLNKELGE